LAAWKAITEIGEVSTVLLSRPINPRTKSPVHDQHGTDLLALHPSLSSRPQQGEDDQRSHDVKGCQSYSTITEGEPDNLQHLHGEEGSDEDDVGDGEDAEGEAGARKG
jgi:hypothetical protein